MDELRKVRLLQDNGGGLIQIEDAFGDCWVKRGRVHKDGIQAQVSELSRGQARLELNALANLPPQFLAKSLPDLQSVIKTVRQRDAEVQRPVLASLSENLGKISPDVPNYWNAIFEFVNYKSFNAAPPNTRSLLSENLPNCTDTPLPPLTVSKVLSPTQFQAEAPAYENCRVTLDSEKDDEAINKVLDSETPFITFKHCLVVYRGGPVNLIYYLPSKEGTTVMKGPNRRNTTKSKITGKSIRFEDCLLDFSAPSAPLPPYGQKMTLRLLAQNTDVLDLP